jgi:hypothetical protein
MKTTTKKPVNRVAKYATGLLFFVMLFGERQKPELIWEGVDEEFCRQIADGFNRLSIKKPVGLVAVVLT